MTTAREIMTSGATCARESDTVHDAAVTMAQKQGGAMPICGSDNRLKGMITDRDIVVKVLAQGKDPSSVTAGELGQGDSETVTSGADDAIDEALRTMKEHAVRRLPVIDGTECIGIVSQADLAKEIDES